MRQQHGKEHWAKRQSNHLPYILVTCLTKYPSSSHFFPHLSFFKQILFLEGCSAVDAGQLSRVTEEEDENSQLGSCTLHRNKDNTCAVEAI